MTAYPIAPRVDDDRARLVALDGFRQRAETYADARRSKGTRRAYKSDFADFTSWCQQHGIAELPAMAQPVALYITACADRGLSVSSIGRRLAAISYYHRNAGIETPTRHPRVLDIWEGIRREKGVAAVGKDAIVTAQLRALVAPLRYSPADIRDRALLLVTFAGAFRRSELVGLNASDVAFVDDGLTIRLRRSKTDQEGVGELVAIAYGSHLPTCPVRALKAWVELAVAVDDEPLFRAVTSSGRIRSSRLTGQSVALIVKQRIENLPADKRAGLDPTKIAGHSLRAGFATTAAALGMTESKIMRQTRHKSSATLRKYLRPATAFVDNASADVGL